MRVTIEADDVLAKFGRSMADLSKKARTEMSRGLHRGGEKTRTQVRRALNKQTSVKRYGAITEGTRSFLEGDLQYVIQAQGKGLPIEDFPFRLSKSKAALVRWSPREHWRLQERFSSGRFGKLTDTTKGKPGVTATMWGVKHGFKRSFAHPKKGPAMVREEGKQAVRTLFGPSLVKELETGTSLSTFQRHVQTTVRSAIEKRLARLARV